ncbi:MAG: polysaccharide deacetylase family protein [Thermoleophilia bacterium]|nr:polysaccharide deacetylase family protein [Thermoleophilia bacterium]
MVPAARFWYLSWIMRYDKVFRLLILAFALGAVLGLSGGLIFGGDGPGKSAASGEVAGDHSEQATSTTGVAVPMTPERAAAIGANEMGLIPVIEYHLIGPSESRWTRTPENLRKDIALLKAEGFYPINLSDLVAGDIDVPAGKTPVVLTFDDSSPGQFRYLDDGTLDPDSAVGIMQRAAAEGDWASRATFFILLDVQPDDRVVFGQPESRKEKLQQLVSWGYEVGSHTVTHLNLKKATREEATKQLAVSKATLEDYVGGGYQVNTISIPFGEYPEDDALLASGQHEGQTYAYRGAVEVAGGPAPSPFSTRFKPLHIPRIEVTGTALSDMIRTFKDSPGLRYVSDGDATAISAPGDLAERLGSVLPDLGRPVVTY